MWLSKGCARAIFGWAALLLVLGWSGVVAGASLSMQEGIAALPECGVSFMPAWGWLLGAVSVCKGDVMANGGAEELLDHGVWEDNLCGHRCGVSVWGCGV